MMGLFDFLINREANRSSFKYERDTKNPVSPLQIFRRMGMAQLNNAFIDCVGCADTEYEDRRNKRPEEPLLFATWHTCPKIASGSGTAVDGGITRACGLLYQPQSAAKLASYRRAAGSLKARTLSERPENP